MRTSPCQLLAVFVALQLPPAASAQVNSGSDGRDGAFNPTQSLTVDMVDHPDGIYQFTSVNIPNGVQVTFKPNARNTPVVWLVQGDCSIAGSISVNGNTYDLQSSGNGGPGGYRGGDAGTFASAGQGPGGGSNGPFGSNASFGTSGTAHADAYQTIPPTYGNPFLLPLIGGSGGGGGSNDPGIHGGGGGGSILIAASGNVIISGGISSSGGEANGGAGSGGSVRVVTNRVSGTGTISTPGGFDHNIGTSGGNGRTRFDVYENQFSGTISGSVFTQGFQPIILPTPGQGIQLAIQSVGGVAVAANPSGVLVNPDVIVPAQQSGPLSIVVRCTNLPLNTDVTVVIRPANGSDLQMVGTNNTGTPASSTATIPVNLPRGGGIIYAKAVSGVAGMASAPPAGGGNGTHSLAETGWTAEGERFATVEVTTSLGGPSQVAYVTESGKRFTLPAQ